MGIEDELAKAGFIAEVGDITIRRIMNKKWKILH